MPPKAEDLPPYVSVSQILTYLQCPRKYRFRYVDHLPPERRKIEMSFGSAVHATIAWWIEERMQARTPPTEILHRIFRADWTAEQAVEVPLVGDKDRGELLALGLGLVDTFVERFASETFTSAEERFEVELVDVRAHRVLPVPLVGFLDFTTDVYVGEVKTASRKTSWRNWELQLAAYSFVAREHLKRSGIRVVQLLKSKSGGIEVEEVPIRRSDERWLVEVGCEIYASACRGAFHPSPTYQCRSCEYESACRPF